MKGGSDKVKPVFIRGLDPELYKQARAEAVRAGKTIGEWLNLAIQAKLNRDIAARAKRGN